MKRKQKTLFFLNHQSLLQYEYEKKNESKRDKSN